MKAGTLIRYSKEFDEKFRYDGKDLGAVCSEEGTIFKVWCPLADNVRLHLYENGETDECVTYDCVPADRGIWYYACIENMHGTYYDYTVYRGGEETRTADPYAKACGCNGSRSMVVDMKLTDPEGFAEDRAPAHSVENIIYELHIKDFSHDPDSDVPQMYRGKYKAFTLDSNGEDIPVCIRHLKDLGITHVHLLPMFDYGWLDESRNDDQFNWGYDPVNYNIPEGSFSTNPYDGVVRIRECKEMVQALHRQGIRVIMDVVYNHTYTEDSWLERTAPGYYNRRWPDGRLANGSACGSDVACGRAMVDNYIANSVMYWAKEYHIDGFRFDLMGLMTVELMNRIRRELAEEFGPGEKLLYGEPWRATDSPMEEGTHAALKSNVGLLHEDIAVFSDDTRDAIKGHVFYEEEPGFVNGGKGLERKILGAVTAWCGPVEDVAEQGKTECDGVTFSPKSCSQIINYVSAHDNFTLWDKLVLSMHGGTGINNEYRESAEPATDESAYIIKYDDVLRANKLAAFIYFTCQGHIFLQAGEEFGRTKYGDSNSYRSHPEVNMLRWAQAEEYGELLAYYKGLIGLRKRIGGLCDKSPNAWKHITGKKILGEGAVSFMIDKSILVIYNAGETDCEVNLSAGDWYVLADEHETDCYKKVDLTDKTQLTIPAESGMMLERVGKVDL